MITNIYLGELGVDKLYLGDILYWSKEVKPSLEAYILAGNAVEALSFAVNTLLGSGVTWQLDVANKQITYTIN